jgi:hypothetical protein
LQAEAACGDLAENTFCVGRGTVVTEFDARAQLPKFAKQSPILATPALAVGESQSIDYLTRLDVGINPDGTTNSESIAVLDIGGVTVIGLGGVTLVNNSPLPQGQISTLTLQNLTQQRLNVRSLPSLGGVILTALDENAPVTAIARSEDNLWVRVRATDGTIGWVSRDLLSASSQFDSLPVNTADQTYFAPMQNLEVYVSDNVTDLTLANALIITVPENAPTALRLGINDYEMEIAPGTVIYWYAADETGEVVDFANEGVVGLYARRRPALFTSEVLVGALRAAPTTGNRQGVTAIGGTAMGFAQDGAQVQAFNPQMLDVAYNALGAVRDNARPLPPLTVDQIQEVRDIQGSLADTSLDTVRELPYNYTVNSVQDPLVYLQENTPEDAPEFVPPTDENQPPRSFGEDGVGAPLPPQELSPFGIPNWCDPGQPWGDGRCDTDDPALRDWFYTMGFIQESVENGTIPYNSVPEEYKPFLQAVPPGGIPAPEPTGFSPIQFADRVECPPSQSVTVVGDFVSQDPDIYLNSVNISGGGAFSAMAYPSGNSFIVTVTCPQLIIQDVYTLVVTDNLGNEYKSDVLLSVSAVAVGNALLFPSSVSCPVNQMTFVAGELDSINGAVISGGSINGSQFTTSFLQQTATTFTVEVVCPPVITSEVVTLTVIDSFGDAYSISVTFTSR